MTYINKKTHVALSRRQVLKGATAIGTVAAASTLGAPMIWAQNIKDITLVHTGMSYSTLSPIARQASEDLGFKIEMAVTDHAGLTNRIFNDPKAIDIADMEYWQSKIVVPQGALQAVEISKISNWDKLSTLFTDATFEGADVSRQGDSPVEFIYRPSKDENGFADGKSDYANFIPGVYNADTLGIRPDLVGREITSWGDLFSSDFTGKTAIQNIPTIGIMDAIMAMEAAGLQTYGDKGNPTRDEIQATIDTLIVMKRDGHFRALWNNFDESVNLMASGEVVIQSMWSPAVAAVRAQGVECAYPGLKEGYRAWGNGLGLMSHLEGLKLEAAYEYLNWYLSGWAGAFVARQGYYTSVPETAKTFMSDNEWGYFYEGKAATADITGPAGDLINKKGDVRDGGSFSDRFSNVAVWNNLMSEAEFLFAKWNDFNAA